MTLPALLPLLTDIDNCARCGHKHEQLAFMPLSRAQHEWTHWAMCPVAGEPVMLATLPSDPHHDEFAMFTALCDANRVMQTVDKTIERGVRDARSAIGDARLNYGQPHVYTWLTKLDQIRNPKNSLPAEPAAAS